MQESRTLRQGVPLRIPDGRTNGGSAHGVPRSLVNGDAKQQLDDDTACPKFIYPISARHGGRRYGGFRERTQKGCQKRANIFAPPKTSFVPEEATQSASVDDA